jgi:hypothetical protein
MVDKEIQIKILLCGDPLRFACEILGVNDMTIRNYAKVFTVSKDEVYEYVSINGIPQDYSTIRYSLTDGFHFFEEEGKWYTCFRERGFIYNDKVFNDYEFDRKYIVDTLLGLSGTGLF